jgi:hypothetical protein
MASRSQPVLAQSGQGEDESSGGWRGIESAPRDQLILAWGVLDPHPKDRELYAGLDRPRRAVCYWDEIDEAWSPVGSTWLGPWFIPSHWHPLPDPPPHPHEEPESGSE